VSTPRNQSVIKAFAMLKSFRRPDEWVTNSELSRRANLPDASGYRLIQTLEEIGAVVRGPRGKYRPGMLLVALSQNVVISELLHEASQSIADDLANRLTVTVHLGLLEGGMVTYVTKAMTPGSFTTHTRAGAQLEAYCSALGKVLLADLPREQLENTVLDNELVALTPHTITDHEALRRHLDGVREQGFALDDRESRLDTCCVAVPIRDGCGRTMAAMSATDSTEAMTPERQAELRDGLLEAAAALSRKVYPAAPSMREPPAPRAPAAPAPKSPPAHFGSKRVEQPIGA
jgi:DNA-binding IclR family transcriptional regulator